MSYIPQGGLDQIRKPGMIGGAMPGGRPVAQTIPKPMVNTAPRQALTMPAPQPGVFGGPTTMPRPQIDSGATRPPMALPNQAPTGGGADLRNDIYRPSGAGPVAGQTNTLANRMVNYQFPGFSGVKSGSYDPAKDTGQVRGMELQQLKEAQAPDRVGLAEDYLTRLEEASNPAWQKNLRTVGQKNASLGRLGSGMVTSDLMDITAQREKDLGNIRGDVVNQAAGQTLSDRLAKLDATRGVFGDFGGEDRANAGMNLDLRNEARGERSAKLGYGLDKFSAQSGLLGQLSGLEGQRFNQGVTSRNEMRTERGYQTDAAQRGIDNALRQRMAEEDLLNSGSNRQINQMDAYGRLGFSGNPSGTLMDAGSEYGQQGQQGMSGLSDYMANQSYLEWLRKNGGVQN